MLAYYEQITEIFIWVDINLRTNTKLHMYTYYPKLCINKGGFAIKYFVNIYHNKHRSGPTFLCFANIHTCFTYFGHGSFTF